MAWYIGSTMTTPERSSEPTLSRRKAVTATARAPFRETDAYRRRASRRRPCRFYEVMKTPTVRMFSDRPVSRETIEWCVRAEHGAIGANGSRGGSCVNPAEGEIRLAAEEEEREFYERRASLRWRDLHLFGTDDDKRFLWWRPGWWWCSSSRRTTTGQTYYTDESVGTRRGSSWRRVITRGWRR